MSPGHFRADEPWDPTEWRDCGWVYPFRRYTGGYCRPLWLDPDDPLCAPCGPDEVCAAAPEGS